MEKDKIIPKEQSTHLKKWKIASFNAPQESQNESPSPNAEKEVLESLNLTSIALPTAEELEKLHEGAFKEGFDAGFSKGLAEGKEKGYGEGLEEGKKKGLEEGFQTGLEKGQEEGFAAGEEEGFKSGKKEGLERAKEEESRKTKELELLLENFAHALQTLKENIAQDVLKLSAAIAQNILHKELTLPQSHLNAILQEAINRLPDSSQKIVVRLNPSDQVFLDTQDFPPKRFDFIEDSTIQKGGCQIDLGESSLDARIETRWNNSMHALGLDEPWEEQKILPNTKSVVSQNPALSSFLEKNLVKSGENEKNKTDILEIDL